MTKRQRVAQLRRRAVFGIFSFVLILTVSVLCMSFKAKAHDNTPDLHKYYKSVSVNCGDTLYSLAVEYNCNELASINDYINEVCSINHLETSDIYAGQYLIIPYYSYEINI